MPCREPVQEYYILIREGTVEVGRKARYVDGGGIMAKRAVGARH